MTDDSSDRSFGRRMWETPYYIHGFGVAVAALLLGGIGAALDLDGAIALVLWLVLAAAAIVVSTLLYSGRGQTSVPRPNGAGAGNRRSTTIYAGIVVSVLLVLVVLQILSSI